MKDWYSYHPRNVDSLYTSLIIHSHFLNYMKLELKTAPDCPLSRTADWLYDVYFLPENHCQNDLRFAGCRTASWSLSGYALVAIFWWLGGDHEKNVCQETSCLVPTNYIAHSGLFSTSELDGTISTFSMKSRLMSTSSFPRSPDVMWLCSHVAKATPIYKKSGIYWTDSSWTGFNRSSRTIKLVN